MGCETVYQILSATHEEALFQNHPLFQQALKAGIISNPALQEEIHHKQQQAVGDYHKVMLQISGMWCPSCAEIIRYFLLQKEGIKQCTVDYVNDIASVEYHPHYFSKDSIFQLIQSLGYEAESLDLKDDQPKNQQLSIRFIVAAFCSLNVMMFAYPLYATYFDFESEGYGLYFAWLSFYFSLPVIFYSAWPIYRRFWLSLKAKQFGMETLVVMGVSASFFLSTYELIHESDQVYFDSMTVIICLVLLGKIVENRAKFSSKNVLNQLAKSFPRKARKRFLSGEQRFVPIKEIQLEDCVVLCQGEKIPLDGLVVDGGGWVDEAVMTGEVKPVLKQIGDQLMSGSILQKGWICYRVTSKLEASTMSQIIHLVEEEIHKRPAYKKMVDWIVQWFVPVVIMIAGLDFLAVYFYTSSLPEAFLQSLSVLLISCPCAIGIAAPIAESHLIQELASQGLVIRDRNMLEHLSRIDCYIFDKTGTVTEGDFQVLEGLEKLSDHERRVLKAMTERSNHLISQAIYKNISEEGSSLTFFEEVSGQGLRAQHGQESYFLGSRVFVERAAGLVLDTKQSPRIRTVVFYAKDGVLLASIHLGDRLKQEIKHVLNSLKPAETILLSGDIEQDVENVALECGFSSWKSSCTPFEKKRFIDELKAKGRMVCMIGDGINDAPALAAAHVGISIKSAADISARASNGILTTDSLQVIAQAKTIAARGQKILKQNLFWAFFYNLIGVALALTGLLTPIFSALAMTLSSLLVVLNAKRIRRHYNWGV